MRGEGGRRSGEGRVTGPFISHRLRISEASRPRDQKALTALIRKNSCISVLSRGRATVIVPPMPVRVATRLQLEGSSRLDVDSIRYFTPTLVWNRTTND